MGRVKISGQSWKHDFFWKNSVEVSSGVRTQLGLTVWCNESAGGKSSCYYLL